jgi:epoxyqueuosine reductase QueG
MEIKLITDLSQCLRSFFEISELNRLHENYGTIRIFDDPIIGVARGDDHIFQEFNKVVGPEHLTPLELWLKEGQRECEASKLRVVSIVFPYVSKIRNESIKIKRTSELLVPAEIYAVGRNYANPFKKAVCRQIIDFFQKKGYIAIAGILSEVVSILVREKIYSNWSERHIAFAAGLGTFSLHEGLITDVGCNIRLASVLTNAPLNITKRRTDDPYGNCLFYAEGGCRKCEERCPANAINENGHDKDKCREYLRKVAKINIERIGPILKPHNRRVDWRLRHPSYPVGCAFCQFGVPCMDKNPTIKK